MQRQETKLDKLFGCMYLLGAHMVFDTILLALMGIAEELVKYTAAIGAVGILAAIIYANREDA